MTISTYAAVWTTKDGNERDSRNCDTADEARSLIPASAVSWRVMGWAHIPGKGYSAVEIETS